MKERSSVGQRDNRIKTYVILRCLLILLVVIGHANYYTVYTDYGGFDWTGVMKACAIEDTIAHRTTCLFTGIIYSFHMPMYIALSGALLEYGTKRDLLTTMKNKAKRLLIPFLVVTTVISLPIKYLTGYWAFSSNILRDHRIYFDQKERSGDRKTAVDRSLYPRCHRCYDIYIYPCRDPVLLCTLFPLVLYRHVVREKACSA